MSGEPVTAASGGTAAAPPLLTVRLWRDLRGDAGLLGGAVDAVAAGGHDRLLRDVTIEDGRLVGTLHSVRLDMQGLWSALRTLPRAAGALDRHVGDDPRAQATELLVEIPGVRPDRWRLLDVTCATAPALLVLLGDGSDQPLEVSLAGSALRLLVPGPPPRPLAAALGIVVALLRDGAAPELLHHPALYSAEEGDQPLLIAQRRAGGRPVLDEGRMTSIIAETSDGRRVCLHVQQSLTALALHAEEDIAALVPPDDREQVRLELLGELPLPVDEPPAAPPPQVRVGPSPERPLLLMLESGPRVRRDILRLARALVDDARVEVVVAPWSQVDFSAESVLLGGSVTRPSSGEPQTSVLEHPVRVDSVFYYATNDERPLGLDDAEKVALRRLGARGMLPSHLDRVCLLGELLEHMSRRGVPNNTPGAEGCFSSKDQLEHMIRGYIRETGRVLRRPETFVAAKAQVPTVLERFARRGDECILKPTRGSRAENIQIVAPGAEWPANQRAGPFVLQHLVPRPFLVDGHKMDLRTYLFVDVDNQQASRGSELVFVRKASSPYQRGVEVAEITNTSYSERLGLPPDIHPLEDTPMPDEARAAIRARLVELMDELVRMRFWWAARRATRPAGPVTPNRVLLWGIDVLVCDGAGGPELILIEANVYPQLYRRSPAANRLAEAMFRDEYIPVLLGARRRIAAGGGGAGRAVPEAS